MKKCREDLVVRPGNADLHVMNRVPKGKFAMIIDNEKVGGIRKRG